MKNLTSVRAILVALIILIGAGISRSANAYTSDEDMHKTDGLGVILGEPTGVTGKFWIKPEQAIDVGLGFSYSDFTMIYADYLFHFHGAFGLQNEFLARLEPYMGVGAEIFLSYGSGNDGHFYQSSTDSSSAGFGIRVPVGAEWFLPRAPLGVFAELVPGIGIAPDSFGFLQADTGIRFYF